MSPSLLSDIVGHRVPLRILQRALELNRIFPAYLFEGQDGIGKELVAFAFAQALLCESRGIHEQSNGTACGICSACARVRLREGVPLHPDLVLLERGLYDPAQIGRRTPEAKLISIEQIHSVVHSRLPFPPYEGQARVFIIRRADELSVSAANALLKVLEEPPLRTCFILLSTKAHSLLPTIRSRMQRIPFGVLSIAEISQILQRRDVNAEQADRIASLADGDAAHAWMIYKNELMAEQEHFVSKVFEAMQSSSPLEILILADTAKKDKTNLPLLLRVLALVLARREREGILKSCFAVGTYATLYERVLKALNQIQMNASPQLVMETLLIQMQHEWSKKN
ncbi:ATP-binding protein [Pajaroellobacter abortibovis]|uniref:DNA polymerase III subunit delta n=1 Tax=Pajaroellobacter abortibovis TaxID=1882918 RepID=A0A1L6MXR2_9BACT|nr:DNA polymerase III subunit [Pajaroellobacter abortibovis]APS00290.1 hypothetical protein BCY86_06035 [Pajaroellobacter abortibovis]